MTLLIDHQAYYGGEARCDQDAAAAGYGDFNPAELICGGCSDVARAQVRHNQGRWKWEEWD